MRFAIIGDHLFPEFDNVSFLRHLSFVAYPGIPKEMIDEELKHAQVSFLQDVEDQMFKEGFGALEVAI